MGGALRGITRAEGAKLNPPIAAAGALGAVVLLSSSLVVGLVTSVADGIKGGRAGGDSLEPGPEVRYLLSSGLNT